MKHHLRALDLKQTAIFCGLAIILFGCSDSYSVSSPAVRGEYTYEEMNEELKGQDVKIELKEGREISAKEVKIYDDSVSWVDQRTGEIFKANIRQLGKIVLKNHSLGGLEGLGFGLIGGCGVGALLVPTLKTGAHDFGGSSGVEFGLIYGGVSGAVLGLTIGSIIGHSYNYEFSTNQQSDSLQNRK